MPEPKLLFTDADGNEVPKDEASRVIIIETDDDGNPTNTTYAEMTPKKPANPKANPQFADKQ